MNKNKLKKILERESEKEWKLQVHAKFNHECAICGSKKYLNAHHVISRSFAPTRFLLENGILLCALHHRFHPTMSAHKGAFKFFLWYIKNFPREAGILFEMLDSV